MAKGKTRTRFAPSPTGYMHVGNLRTALYAYLLAKADDGTFILRIEDTDQERQVEGATDIIYNTLRDTNLLWDEGPDIGGPVGPYVQSERKDIYKEYAEKLVELGHAYYCFCDKERLDEMKTIQKASGITPKYDGCCRKLSKEEVEEKLKSGIPYVIRQKIPETGSTTFHDEIFGSVTAPNDTLDDNVLLKADGMPTYNFANVIDDHLMGITHVLRGTEYLSSAPKYNLLYEAYGWEIPKYVHCSPVMKDETHKLSKRNGDASYEDLVAKGYLKDAILNYIALLGWSPKGEREIFTLEEMQKEFSIEGISKSPSIFDVKKLNFINQEYIKAMSEEEFKEAAMPYIKKGVKRTDVNFDAIAKVLHTRTEIFSDIPEQLDFIDKLPEYDIALYTHKKMKTNPENALQVLEALLPKLEAIDENNFTHDPIYNAVTETIKELDVKNGVVFYPFRVATSGKAFTPGGGVEIGEIIGKEDTINRVKTGIEKLK